MGCFHADECNQYNDVAPYDCATITVREIYVALCESRHEIPAAINGSIYPREISDPMNFGLLREIARDILNPAFMQGVTTVNVYVTGLTPALLTVINYCRECGVTCVTWHYNSATGEYQPLPML